MLLLLHFSLIVCGYNAPGEQGCVVFVKGAVEHLLPMCISIKDAQEKKMNLSQTVCT